MNLKEHIAARIRELRTSFGGHGMSQEALGNALNVPTNTVSRWETGTYKPTVQDLDKLARYFKVSVLTFFPPEQQPPNQEVATLMRLAGDLSDTDVQELVRYAEYRLAQQRLRDTAKRRQN